MKMNPSLPLLFCELPVSLKEDPVEDKNMKNLIKIRSKRSENYSFKIYQTKI